MAECIRRVPSRLILMRHAKSDYPPGVADHDRPLNARGRRDAAVAGHWLALNRTTLVRGRLTVLVSSAVRAQQTWGLAGDGFAMAYRTEPSIYEAAVSTLFDLADAVEDGTVLIIGHNPTIEQALAHLVPADSELAHAAVKTCAIAVLDLDPEHPWSSGTAEPVAFEVPRAD